MDPESLITLMKEERVRGASWFFDMAVEALKVAGDRAAEVAERMRGIMPIVDCLVDMVLEDRDMLHVASLLRGREVECGLLDADTVTTISLSSAVHRCIRLWRPAKVYLLESRPGEELSEAVRRYSDVAQVVVLPDTAMSQAVRESAAVVIGADIVTPTHLYNKVGSLPLSLTAMLFGRPLVAVFESFKICGTTHVNVPVRQGVEILDAVPIGLIKYFVTDIGVYRDPASLLRAHGGLVRSLRAHFSR